MSESLINSLLPFVEKIKALAETRGSYEQSLAKQFREARKRRLYTGSYGYNHERLAKPIKLMSLSKLYLNNGYIDKSYFVLDEYNQILDAMDRDHHYEALNLIGFIQRQDIEVSRYLNQMTQIIAAADRSESEAFFKKGGLSSLLEYQQLEQIQDPSGNFRYLLRFDCGTARQYIIRTSDIVPSRNGRLIQNLIIDEPYTQDAILVNTNDTTIRSNTIQDTILSRCASLINSAHRDAIQILPVELNQLGDRYDGYAGAVSNNITIRNNHINSIGSLQGIFSSDGLHRNLKIENNTIVTRSAHKVSINGMISGKVANNHDDNGLCDILLQPMRLGGNINYVGNLWFLDIRETEYQYHTIAGILPNQDRRNELPNDFGYRNFPLNIFKQQYSSSTMISIEQKSDAQGFIQLWITSQPNANELNSYYQANKSITPLVSVNKTNLRCVFIQELAITIALEGGGVHLLEGP